MAAEKHDDCNNDDDDGNSVRAELMAPTMTMRMKSEIAMVASMVMMPPWPPLPPPTKDTRRRRKKDHKCNVNNLDIDDNNLMMVMG